ncbi:MAG: RagB/SusD family nutrient uptake outer membrane protein, partial [Bacteroidales bacterium]|nr:RagB/SusD family nutrient uptake outer membrane protein [Bacteroidales bacterium]
MKKILYSFTALCLSALTLSSCDGFLNADNKSAGSDANEYFSTEEGLASLKNQAYFSLCPLVTTTDYNEWGTDIYTTGRSSDPNSFHKYASLTAEDGSIKSFYINAYKMINYANGVIYYNEASRYADEAKFLRNYGYYLLTQQFGAVPYITSYINSGERSYPRTELSSIYISMIVELEDLYAASSLPDASVDGVASKRAVAALLAKVYLAAGWDLHTTLKDAAKGSYEITSTNYFNKAHQWAETAINGQTLNMSFADKWSPFNENNEEIIFSVQYQREGYAGDILNGGHGLQ